MSVENSNYTCKVGFRHCNHILGLLDLLCHYEKKRFKNSAMCNFQNTNAWHIPQRVYGASPETVEDTEVQKISKTKRKRTDGVEFKMCCMLQQPLPFYSIITNLSTLLRFSNLQFKTLLPLSIYIYEIF